MADSLKDVNKIPFSIATVSVANTSTPLFSKLRAIAAAGFTGIELGFPDLLSYANSAGSQIDRQVFSTDYDALCTAAARVKRECAILQLKIMMLQPFANFEGWPKDSSGRRDAFERARGWIRIMMALGTDMLQVGSSDTPGISRDFNVLASDLRELADMLAEHGLRMAYENWCWATAAPTWRDVHKLVELVDRDNVGLCLDTFQTLGYEYADPSTANGARSIPYPELRSTMQDSLAALSKTIPSSEIYLLQISSAYKAYPPRMPDSPKGTPTTYDNPNKLRARGRWSAEDRPLPYKDGYLPCRAMCRAVLETGARSWWSVEVFDGKTFDAQTRYTEKVMREFCEEAIEAVKILLKQSAEAVGEKLWEEV